MTTHKHKPAEPEITFLHMIKVFTKTTSWVVGITVLVVLTFWVFSSKMFFDKFYIQAIAFFDTDFFIYLLVGFVAQMIDGALGMAYGISSTSFLVNAGVSPAFASASVHFAEIFTTAASGYSHWKMGNVSKKLFRELVIPGVIGAMAGAFFVSYFDGSKIKIWISLYLLIMGLVIVFRALQKQTKFKKIKRTFPLALLGGFIDSSGGGGWGPVVTTTFIGSGAKPKLTIGTVNAVEFFVALFSSGVFTLMLSLSHYKVVAGLIIGGIVAAPWGAWICNKINIKIAMMVVGLVIVFISMINIFKTFVH